MTRVCACGKRVLGHGQCCRMDWVLRFHPWNSVDTYGRRLPTSDMYANGRVRVNY